uniref:Cation/H+ exchanger transmembrane domain-containing protein n=1 Tax=Haptolina brevifila TaxID=156173 RepID=A0A7S2NN70_9EUKA|mmetsp:Transcript_83499/g.166715  ORF Transcript_83499/g.166715 Transcript_83499/m.166715 type:complete len:1005 (+) Transcript_83499:63-3077(+)
MGGFDFEIALQIGFFLFAVWFVSRLFQHLKMPPILGQLVVGIFLGPNGIDMVPYASNGHCKDRLMDPWEASSMSSMGSVDSLLDANITERMLAEIPYGRALAGGATKCTDVEWFRWEDGLHLTNVWTFVGNLGVTLMIMESGMHIHFDKVASVGKKATIVAIFGTALPIIFGIVVVGGLFIDSAPDSAFYPWGFAAGCAFAPTSVGISIRLLDESKMLNSMAGQTTLIAAFIDDVFSLVTLVILQTLAKCSISAASILVPLICSFAFLGLGAGLAIKVFPKIDILLQKIPLQKNASIQQRDEVHICLMFLSLFLFGFISSIPTIPYYDADGIPFIGSHLLGAFVAGMVWVNVPRSHKVWETQLKRIVKWMMRLFFACSVGFAVPVSKMFSPEAVWRGIVLGIGPCVGTKLFSGLFARMQFKDDEAKQLAKAASWATKLVQPQQLLVGIAMVARGEFAYLVAETAANSENGCKEGTYMMSQDVYAAVMWALVMATICAPVMFRWALGIFDRATAVHRSVYIGGGDDHYLRKAFVIRIAGKYVPGVQKEIFNTMYAAGVEVLDSTIMSVRKDDSPDAEISQFVNTFTVLSRGKKKDFDDEKLSEMHHAFTEILNDNDAQIIFAPPVDMPNKDGVVEVQIIGEHHPSLLQDIMAELSKMGLDMIKARVDQSLQPKSAHGGGEKKGETESSLHPDLVGGDSSTRRRNSRSDSVGTETSDAPDPETGELKRRPSLGRRLSMTAGAMANRAAISGVIYSQTKKGEGDWEHEESEHLTIGTEVFYMKERDEGKWTDAARRDEIRTKLVMLLKDKKLHGEVIVRTMHASEVALVHTLPKFTAEQKESAIIVKCSGKSHQSVLHELVEYFAEDDYEVLHAEIDSDHDQQVIIFWLKREDAAFIYHEERAEIKKKLLAIYDKKEVHANVEIASEGEQKRRPSLVALTVSRKDDERRERDSAEAKALMNNAARARRASREKRASKEGKDLEPTPETKAILMQSVTSASSTTTDAI